MQVLDTLRIREQLVAEDMQGKEIFPTETHAPRSAVHVEHAV
jgi:hypothetical protein